MALTRLNNRSVSAVTSFVTPTNLTTYSNIGPWQHIETRVFSTDTVTPINFFVFNNNYAAYKVILPYWNCVTENAEFYLRFTNSSANAITDNYYYQSRTMMAGADNSHNQVTYYPTNEGVMWDDYWSSENGGVHGEITIYNASAPTLNSVDTNRGTWYRPYATYTLVGYDATGQGYSRVDGAIRYNLENPASYYSGFQLYHSGYAAVKAKSYAMVYGLRKI